MQDSGVAERVQDIPYNNIYVTWMQGNLHTDTMLTLSCTVSVQKIQEGLPCRMLYFESKYLRLIMVCFITVGVL